MRASRIRPRTLPHSSSFRYISALLLLTLFALVLLALFRITSSTLQEVKLLDVGPMALTDNILIPLVITDADNVLLPRLNTLHVS